MKKYNIYKRRDGRFEGRLSKGKSRNGRRCFRYFFGYTREEVENKIDNCRGAEQNSTCSLTVGQLFSEWFQHTQYKIKESTAANYRMKAEKHVLPVFSDMRADSIDESSVYHFIESRQQKGLSNRYISDIIVMMKSVFKYAVRKYHFFNPLDGINMPRTQKPEIRLLDSKEKKKLQQYIAENPNNTTLGVALSMSTGIRIGELCAMQWQDIDLEKRILTVRKTIQRIQVLHNDQKTKLIITEPKSESSKRNIPVPECIIPFLKKFKGAGKEYIVSGSEKPTEPRTLQYRFASILKNVGLPSVHFHALRHIFATNCVKLGFDIKSLSEILGHSSVEITMNKYVHSSFELKEEYMKRISMNF